MVYFISALLVELLGIHFYEDVSICHSKYRVGLYANLANYDPYNTI